MPGRDAYLDGLLVHHTTRPMRVTNVSFPDPLKRVPHIYRIDMQNTVTAKPQDLVVWLAPCLPDQACNALGHACVEGGRACRRLPATLKRMQRREAAASWIEAQIGILVGGVGVFVCREFVGC